MKFPYSKQWINYIQILLCSAIGMSCAYFAGKSGAVTITATAMLVLYTDRGYAGSFAYILERIKLQLVIGGMVFILLSIFRFLFPGHLWFAEVMALLLSIAAGLILFHNKFLGPLSVSVGITAIIMLTGISQNPVYFFTRLRNCIIGCLLAAVLAVISLILQRRHHKIHDQVKTTTLALTTGQRDDPITAKTHQETGKLLQILENDKQWEKNLSVSQLNWLHLLHKMNEALQEVYHVLQQKEELLQSEWFSSHLEEAQSTHLDFANGEAAMLIKCRPVEIQNEQEAYYINCLFQYIRTINEGITQIKESYNTNKGKEVTKNGCKTENLQYYR